MSDESRHEGSGAERGVEHLNLGKAAAVVVVFLLVAVLLLAKATHPEATSGSSSVSTTTTTHAGGTTTTTTIPRSKVTVQVANGSSAAGVATRVTQQLQTQGWNTLPPVNASAQVPASVVYYAVNRKPQALEIATELGLAATAVQPLSSSVPVNGAAGDDVVVIIGPDLAKS